MRLFLRSGVHFLGKCSMRGKAWAAGISAVFIFCVVRDARTRSQYTFNRVVTHSMQLIILLVIAGALMYWLFSILGQTTGSENQNRDQADSDPFNRKKPDARDSSVPGAGRLPTADSRYSDNVVELPTATKPAPKTVLGHLDPVSPKMREKDLVAEDAIAGITDIRKVDSGFRATEFAKGAEMAFDLILTAFVNGDLDELRPLVTAEVYDGFAASTRAREQANQSVEINVDALDKLQIVAARLDGQDAYVDVAFDVQESTVIKNEDGRVVDPVAAEVRSMQHVWSFMRDTQSQSPNWVLIGMKTEVQKMA
jgi:predicted lipid-binding transport protein (Tim44 family)